MFKIMKYFHFYSDSFIHVHDFFIIFAPFPSLKYLPLLLNIFFLPASSVPNSLSHMSM